MSIVRLCEIGDIVVYATDIKDYITPESKVTKSVIVDVSIQKFGECSITLFDGMKIIEETEDCIVSVDRGKQSIYHTKKRN